MSYRSFFFNDTATTEIYTLSLHDALPISLCWPWPTQLPVLISPAESWDLQPMNQGRSFLSREDRKSTRLNSSHGYISYAVFCLKKKTTGSAATPFPKAPSTRFGGTVSQPS